MNQGAPIMDDEKARSLKTITTVVYALQAASFLLGITFIVAVIINYVKKSDVQGTWLESHFLWQIRTFWFGFLWSVFGLLTVFMIVGYYVLIANAIWIIYRIVKGWLRLADSREMYVTAQGNYLKG
ncbi:MAG TPA: hypothetical protein ENN34_05920 [Deltaproteobacteria bacterium]|nr:hypothetical protein [Deltaproteobacteria bacterium]